MDNAKVDQTSTVAPNSPQLDDKGRQHMPALTSIGQAIELVKALDAENSDRSKKNARIMSKYNAERPYDPAALKADGLSWRSNFSTKPLASLIEKVVPRFSTAVRSMRYLTASALPQRIPGATEKTEAFREAITKLCRSREGWDDLITEISMENSLFGYTAVSWLDEYSWLPTQFRQDDFLVPRGTKHTAKSAHVFCVRERLLPHQLFEVIRNLEAAKIQGWDTDAVINSINEAVPQEHKSGFSDTARIYADLQRETAVIQSFSGMKQIAIWHVFVAEVDGRITHVAFDDGESKRRLFWKEKQFERMADGLSIFSFQHGGGTIHGSKGIGRELYAMAGVLDRNRNEVVDRLNLAGKLVLQCEDKELRRFKMSVIGACVLIDRAYNIAQMKIEPNVEAFFALDEFLTKVLDDVAGSTSPKAFEGDRVTKAAVDLYAAREEEKQDALLSRFLLQFATMMSTIQRRACNPSVLDADAREMQAQLLQVMTPEELNMLAAQPAVQVVQDYSEVERQQIVLWAQEAKGNPLYNQREVEKKSLSARFDPDFAESVLLPENDPTEAAEQQRFQQLEAQLLLARAKVPVSPRDNHLIHIQVLRDIVMGLVEALKTDPSKLPSVKNIAEHIVAHAQAAEQTGQGKALAELKPWITELVRSVQTYEQQELQAQAQMNPSQNPPDATA